MVHDAALLNIAHFENFKAESALRDQYPAGSTSQMGTLEFGAGNAEGECRKKAEPVSPALKRARLSMNRLQLHGREGPNVGFPTLTHDPLCSSLA